MTSRTRKSLDFAPQANKDLAHEHDNILSSCQTRPPQLPNSFIVPVSTNENLVFQNLDIETIPIVLANDVEIENVAYEHFDKGVPTVNKEDHEIYVEATTSSLSLRDTEKDPGNTLNCSEDEDDYNNDDEDYFPTHGSGRDSDDSITETESEESNNDVSESVQPNATSVEWGDINDGRKRKKLADKSEWKRVKNEKLRMKGKEYLGFSRDKNKTFKHSTPRSARTLGARCSSKMCLKSKKRFCSSISEDTRKEIFTTFWEKMTWDQRKVFVSAHVSLYPPSRKTTEDEASRRSYTLIYRLPNGAEAVQVCRNTFLSTTGLGRFTVETWVKNSKHGMTEAKSDQNENRKNKNHRVIIWEERKRFLEKFFDDLPKQPSHYVRKDTSKWYLEQRFATLQQLYECYKETCEEKKKNYLGIKCFRKIFNQKNLSLFTPKKDRCDLCIEYEKKNVDEDKWKKHIEDKNRSREERSKDRDRASRGECILLCMDVQAVKVAPTLNATKIYFKTKLGCHNFTIYNITSHQATCFWFTEIDSGLTASTFVSCVIDYLERHCLLKKLPIIIYSDGCTFQNRNNVLANALLNFARLHNIEVTQKYLTKGHTQMECDSVHACIERKLKNREIELPSDYVKASREARRNPEPYEVIQLSYNFFKDYSRSEYHRYPSIRPDKDHVITDIKALNYDPNGNIRYKLDFSHEYQDLPSRPKVIAPVLNFPQQHKARLPITEKKWKDLQAIKGVISQECHSFYDLLPYLKKKQNSEYTEKDPTEDQDAELQPKKMKIKSKTKKITLPPKK